MFIFSPRRGCIVIALVLAVASHASAVSFELTKGAGILALEAGTPAEMALAASIMGSATTAADLWSAKLGDPIVVKLIIDASPALPSLAATTGGAMEFSYASIKAGLDADVSSPVDTAATASLQAGPALKVWRNDLFDLIPPGSEPFLDADVAGPLAENNLTLWLARANAKAIGILPAADGLAGADGTIAVKTTEPWDFDYTDGIAPLTKDLVGTFAHEMGHALGFTSGVDIVTALLPPVPLTPPALDPNDVWTYSILDLFRYSSESASLIDPFVPDVSLPTPGHPLLRFLSIDGGATPLTGFIYDPGTDTYFPAPGFMSTGIGLSGDGKQAGHWLDNTFPLDGFFRGLMDPTLVAGFPLTEKFLDIAAAGPSLDLLAFDIIGYEVIPEPASAVLLFVGALAACRSRKSAVVEPAVSFK